MPTKLSIIDKKDDSFYDDFRPQWCVNNYILCVDNGAGGVTARHRNK